ncbi:hypothetical protein VNO77_02933 [Canavalia gladiata]|uniref:Uncharacterized protein n=1 Tax=Canavalia gladiata TaxID=3824 RepID=A0AAN9MTV6_CANGL
MSCTIDPGATLVGMVALESSSISARMKRICLRLMIIKRGKRSIFETGIRVAKLLRVPHHYTKAPLGFILYFSLQELYRTSSPAGWQAVGGHRKSLDSVVVNEKLKLSSSRAPETAKVQQVFAPSEFDIKDP